MDISKKSIGMLIDELSVTNIKCWFAQERLLSAKDDHDIAKAAKDSQMLNLRRNSLIRSIDEALGQTDITVTDKSYGKS